MERWGIRETRCLLGIMVQKGWRENGEGRGLFGPEPRVRAMLYPRPFPPDSACQNTTTTITKTLSAES